VIVQEMISRGVAECRGGFVRLLATRLVSVFIQSVLEFSDVLGAKSPESMKLCATCHKTEPEVSLKMCARCKKVFYCCRKCQTEDWPNHRKTCGHEIVSC
jgi:uncharacterized paraquat-inducible protein A